VGSRPRRAHSRKRLIYQSITPATATVLIAVNQCHELSVFASPRTIGI
jgi:hypothetical protein